MADITLMPEVSQKRSIRKLTKNDFLRNRKPIRQKYNFASDVKKYKESRYSQNFAQYSDIYGQDNVNYDLIDGLYHSTILNRVIKKISSDAVPEMFKVQIVDLEGNRIPELEQLVDVYLAHLKRKHINQMFNYTMRYGTGFLYIGNKQEDQLVNMFCLHPKDLNPIMDESTGEIKEWEYQTREGIVVIPDEDLLRFAYDPDIGDVFGMSFVDVVGFAQSQYDMESTLAQLKESFGLLTFPMAIIGGKADNLSAIKIQASQYVGDLKDLQMSFSDEIVEQVIEPFLESQGKMAGIDYSNIYLVFPALTVESNADIATWVLPLVRHGIISRDEARGQFGFRGKALNIEELDFIDASAKYLQEMALTQTPEGDNPKSRNGKGDTKE